MKNLWQLLKRQWRLSIFFLLLAIIYSLLTVVTPPSRYTLSKYHVDSFQLFVLQLAVMLPYLVIWVIGLVGYLRLHEYTVAMGRSKDGKAFGTISVGVLWFALWPPLSSLINAAGGLVMAHHPPLTDDVIRIENYANLLILVPAFVYIYLGARRLVLTVRGLVPAVSQRTTLFFIAFSAFYTFVTLEDAARRIPADAATPASYYLADWLIVLTIVIPRLLMWYLGVQGVQLIRQYRRKVPGVIYRKALQRLAIGIGVTVLMIILLRLLQSLMNPLSHLSLSLLFLLVYALLIGLAVGYVLIAKGSRQLQNIEEA
jgi:hypothetical protein